MLQISFEKSLEHCIFVLIISFVIITVTTIKSIAKLKQKQLQQY